MIAGRWFITPHAVRRYIERVRPGLDYEQALAEITEHSLTARRVKEIAPGIDLWRGAKPLRLRFRVAADQRRPDGSFGKPQLLTVMGGHDGWRTPC